MITVNASNGFEITDNDKKWELTEEKNGYIIKHMSW